MSKKFEDEYQPFGVGYDHLEDVRINGFSDSIVDPTKNIFNRAGRLSSIITD